MKVNPQEENGIIKMIMRDIFNILSQTRKFNFSFNGEVKLQKVMFLVAKNLDIPLTRSWYQYGPFVHNENIDFERLSVFPISINEEDKKEIEHAEQIFADFQGQYWELLNSLVPDIFYKKINDVLLEIYDRYAPELYKPAYLLNLDVKNSFKNVTNALMNEETTIEEVSDKVTRKFSEMASCIACFEDMPSLYDYMDEYLTTIQGSFIKFRRTRQFPLAYLDIIRSTYERSIWLPVSVKISINTIEGVSADVVKAIQSQKYKRIDGEARVSLSTFRNMLGKDNMLASIEEKTQYYNEKYGTDKDFTDALANVWKAYK